MYRFFVDQSQVTEDQITINGADVNHMKNVLRFKAGKNISVSAGDGKVYHCTIHGYEGDLAVLKIDEVHEASSELPVTIDLYQGLPKKDKMELVVQKSVELGASSIIPVMMKRSVVKLDQKNKVKKTARWQSIADAAAKQAKRDDLPEVGLPLTFNEMLEALKDCDMVLVPYESAKGIKYTREVLSEVRNCDKIGIIIGPEGGFDDQEIDRLSAMEARIITLGKRILRTETAGLALLSYLMIDLEEE